jgi:hypothetical protein
MIIRSGHRWADLMRMIELSYRASRTKFEEFESCQYRSATNNIPRSRLPTNKKYRPKGTLLTTLLSERAPRLSFSFFAVD